MNRFFFLVLIFLVAILFFTGSSICQDNNEVIRISKIKIKGLKDLDKEKLKNSMATEFPNWKPWVEKPVFVEIIFKDDIERIKSFIGEYGYYNATVKYDLKYKNDRKNVEIVIRIEQGEPVILEELEIIIQAGYEDEFDTESLSEIPLRVLDNFSVIKFQASKAIIADILANKGYPRAEILSEARVNRKENWARVNFDIDPGQKYTFGDISFKGTEKIEKYLVEREVTYEKGETFSAEQISKSQSRIFKLGFFRSVIIDTEYNDELLTVDTVYNVVERKLGNIRVGAGFGAEDKLRGQVVLTQKNFFGGGRNLEISSKLSFITQNVETKLIQPYILGQGSEAFLSLKLERDDFPSYRGNSVKSDLNFSKDISDFITVFVSSGVNYSRISSQASRTPIEESQDNVFLTLLSSGIKFNNTDNFLDPSSGIFSSIIFESSIESLGSDVNYLKSLYEFRGYKKLYKFVLAKRFQIGFIETFGSTDELDVPIFKRFFAGGSTSMRGFSFQKLGPLDDSEDPVGGNSVIVGNVEARFPVIKDIGGVVFFDYGNVYSDSFDFDLNDLRYAVGFGLRYNTLVGPIRADFGYTLNPNDELRRFQIFISIGQAF